MRSATTESKEFEVTVTRERFEYHATVTVPKDSDPFLEITRRYPNSPSKENRSLHGVFRMPKYLHHLQAIAELVEEVEEELKEIEP